MFTGTFDPLTLGHLDVIRRGRLLFEHLVVGIGVNPNKASLFNVDERVEMARRWCGRFANVSVESFEGLTVQFVRRIGARVILRGLRTLSDMEYEFGMTLTNHRLDPEVETVFLMADGEYSHVSSSLIKQVAYFGGAEALAAVRARGAGRADPRQGWRTDVTAKPRGDEQVARPLPQAEPARPCRSLVQRLDGLPGAVEVGIAEPAGEPVVLDPRPRVDHAGA